MADLGYQSFEWYKQGKANHHRVTLNDLVGLKAALMKEDQQILHLYTQHQIFFRDGVLQQTRSSPNWLGGMVTFATCKHFMRCGNAGDWEGKWIVGLCPKKETNNCLLFAGQVFKQFPSNYVMAGAIQTSYPDVYKAKRASDDPRGDLYTSRRRLRKVEEQYDHANFLEPPNHTRSVEYYKHSPGSVSDREDGKVPKWWRDLEYAQQRASGAVVRPPVFMLAPCWLFSQPMAYTAYSPGRACLRLTTGQLATSLVSSPL